MRGCFRLLGPILAPGFSVFAFADTVPLNSDGELKSPPCRFALVGSSQEIIQEEFSALDGLPIKEPKTLTAWWFQLKLQHLLRKSELLKVWHDRCVMTLSKEMCDRIAMDFPTLVRFAPEELPLFEKFIRHPRIQKLWTLFPGPVVISYHTLEPTGVGYKFLEYHGWCKRYWPFHVMVSAFQDGKRGNLLIHEMAHRFWFTWVKSNVPYLVSQLSRLREEQLDNGIVHSNIFPERSFASLEEYWADAVAAYFYEGETLYDDEGDPYMVPKAVLKRHNPELFNLVDAVFGP